MRLNPEFDYAERHLPDRWTILGVKLNPFRNGHKLLLQRIESPFVCEVDRDFVAEDLFLAIWFCSRPYLDGVKSLFEPRPLLWRLWEWRMERLMKKDELIFFSRVEMMFKYIEDAHRGPSGVRYVTQNDEGPHAERTYAPPMLVLKRDLCAHFPSLTEEAFFEMPVSKALIERAGILEDQRVLTWPAPNERAKW